MKISFKDIGGNDSNFAVIKRKEMKTLHVKLKGKNERISADKTNCESNYVGKKEKENMNLVLLEKCATTNDEIFSNEKNQKVSNTNEFVVTKETENLSVLVLENKSDETFLQQVKLEEKDKKVKENEVECGSIGTKVDMFSGELLVIQSI